MRKKYRLLVFDWDGTLVNSKPIIVASLQKTAQDLQLPIPSFEEIAAGIGMPATYQVKRLFPNIEQNEFIGCFRKNYQIYKEKERLFNDTLETLEYLHNEDYLLAIATSKIRSDLLTALEKFHLKNLFSGICCGDDEFTKPNPQVLFKLLEKFSIDAKNTLMVGDHEADILCAKQANIDVIAVDYENQNNAFLMKHKPLAIINNIAELKSFLSTGEKGK